MQFEAVALLAVFFFASPHAAHGAWFFSDEDWSDSRETFQTGFYLGDAIDTFAASDLKKYLNPESAGTIQHRMVGGIQFDYRLMDRIKRQGNLWLFGQTVHGMRSSEIDCHENPSNPLCQGQAPNIAGQKTLYILRNASSLEGFIGSRFEFFQLNRGSSVPANLYIKAQAGFITVSGMGDDLADMHSFGFGLTVPSGNFVNSFLEYGFGTNDLFLTNRYRRHKIGALLTWDNPLTGAIRARPFVELSLDTDFGGGSDNVQTYVGLDFDIENFLGSASWFSPTPGD